jgi:hypothetical protein
MDKETDGCCNKGFVESVCMCMSAGICMSATTTYSSTTLNLLELCLNQA